MHCSQQESAWRQRHSHCTVKSYETKGGTAARAHVCNGCGVVRRVLMERATRTIMLAQATAAGTVGQHSALLRPPLAMRSVRLRVKTDVVKRHRPCAGIRSVSVPEIEETLQDPAPSSRGDVRARQRELCARPTQASRGGEERRRRPGDRHRKDANGRRVNPASVAGAGGGWQARLAGALDSLLHLEQRHTHTWQSSTWPCCKSITWCWNGWSDSQWPGHQKSCVRQCSTNRITPVQGQWFL